MKITYMKLVNFAGIYAGMGIREFELDLSNQKNNIILLKASNGSGKTVILSNLNPYRESFDSRKSLIIKDDDGEIEDGLKEIHYDVNGKEVIIKHYYSRNKNKSYVQVDGKEMNENGNIKSAYVVIEDVLSVSKDYFTVGRLGDNVSNFINFKTAKRKEYINTFVPDIDPYLNAYAVSNDKFKEMKNNFNSLNSELTKYAESSILKNELDELNKTIKGIDDDINQLLINEGSEKSNIEKAESELSNIDFSSFANTDNNDYKAIITYIKGLVWQKDNELENANSIMEDIYNTAPTMRKFDDDKLKELVMKSNLSIKSFNESLESNKNELSTLKDKISDIEDNINDVNIKIDGINLVNVEELLDKTESVKSQIKEAESIEFDIEDKYKSLFDDIYDYRYLEDNLSKYISLYNEIKDRYNSGINELGSTVTEIHEYMNTLNKDFQNKSFILENMNNDYNSIINNPEVAEALNNHNSNCSAGDNCPFQSIILKSKSQMGWKDTQSLEILINEANDTLMKDQDKINSLSNELNELENLYNRAFSLVGNIPESIVPNELRSLDGIINSNEINSLNHAYNQIKSSIEYHETQSNISTLNNQLNELIKDKETNDKLSGLVDSYKSQLETFISNKESLINDYNEKTNQTEKINANIKKENLKLTLLNRVTNARNTVKESNDELDKMNKLLDDSQSLIDTLKNAKVKLYNIQNDVSNKRINKQTFEGKKNKIIEDLSIIKNTQKRLDELDKVFKYFSIIKKATDPKKGIPLIFSNMYLKSIAETANKLLDVAYNGGFAIDFQLTQRDFFVHVYKDDGSYLDDILEASQGEQSLTNLSLSLALLNKVSSGYNVLYLDEVDGVLSTENRAKFIEMLQKQIDELNIEQTFVISHNNSFDSTNIDIILLNGNDVNVNDKDFMQGKNVLFNIDEYSKKLKEME